VVQGSGSKVSKVKNLEEILSNFVREETKASESLKNERQGEIKNKPTTDKFSSRNDLMPFDSGWNQMSSPSSL